MPKSLCMSWCVHKLPAGCNGYKTNCVVIYTRIPVPCFGCHSLGTFAWAQTETYCKLHKLCPYLRCYNGHIVLQSGNQVVCVSSGIHAHLNLVFQFVSRTWYITSGCDWNMGGRRGDGRGGGHITWICTLTCRTVLFWLTSPQLTLIWHIRHIDSCQL